MTKVLCFDVIGRDWDMQSNAERNGDAWKDLHNGTTGQGLEFTGLVSLSKASEDYHCPDKGAYLATLSVIAKDKKGYYRDLFNSKYSCGSLEDLAEKASLLLEKKAKSFFNGASINPVFFTYDTPIMIAENKLWHPLTKPEMEEFEKIYSAKEKK